MAFTGSFLGFSYSLDDGTLIHSSDLGIVRVSDGDRFNDGLTPSFKDKTTTINGANRTYYFGTDYTSKTLTVNFAFEKLTDMQLRQLRQLFGSKKIHKLIFDETPYKAYWVKPQSAPSLKYVAFDSGEVLDNSEVIASGDPVPALYRQGTAIGSRWYNGEGTISFVAYEPFAHSVYKYADQYSDTYSIDWKTDVDLKNSISQDSAGRVIDQPHQQTGETNIEFYVYNPGDFDTDFQLYLPITLAASVTKTETITIQYNASTNLLTLDPFVFQSSDSRTDNGIVIDTKLHLVEGIYYSNGNITRTGHIYNQYISAGDFFQIPMDTTDNLLKVTTTNTISNSVLDYEYIFY